MAQLQLIKQSAGILIPATPETSDFLHSKCKLGAVLEAEFRQLRNPAFHRKFFALLNLGFDLMSLMIELRELCQFKIYFRPK